MKWTSFVAGLSARTWRKRARAELRRAVEEGQFDDVIYAVAACRTLEAMGFREVEAIRFAEFVNGPIPVPSEEQCDP